MQKLLRKVLRAVAEYDPTYYDMYDDPNEAFFARVYLERITRHLALAHIEPPARILDAGCQAGRLAIPLAQRGFQVTGVDTSRFALTRARRHAAAVGVRVHWQRGDVPALLRRSRRRGYDAIVCAEVVYLQRRYRDFLASLARALRPGGLLFVSHRPRLYYFVEALRHHDLATARLVLKAQEGQLGGLVPGRGYYNWHTEEQLRQLYSDLGLRWISVYPIDQFAWLSRMNPSRLTREQQEAWLQLELQSANSAATCGRYALVVAEQPVVPPDR